MGACPSDLAGPTGGPPASTDEVKEKQSKVRDAGVKATAAKKGLDSARKKLKILEDELASIVEELNLADVRISDKELKAAAAKPDAKPEADRQVAVAKAEKNRLDARKKAIESPTGPKQKAADLVKKLEAEVTAADTELATAKGELDAALKTATDPAAIKKTADEAEIEELTKDVKDELDKVKIVDFKNRASKLLNEFRLIFDRIPNKDLRPDPTSKTANEFNIEIGTELVNILDTDIETLVSIQSKIALSSKTPLSVSELTSFLEDVKRIAIKIDGRVRLVETKIEQFKRLERRLKIREWLDTLVDKSNITQAEVLVLLGRGITEDELEQYVNYLRNLTTPEVINLPPKPIPGGRRRTYRKHRGGDEPVKGESQQETTKRELKELPPISPVLRGDLVKKGSLPKGGRRRTFRKKKIQQIEKQLEAIKKSLTDIIKE
jgi:hypothetical protein